MKIGKTLPQLAAEIERQAQAKRDFVIDTAAAEAVLADDGKAVALRFGDHQFGINEHAHRQIGSRLGIRAEYYDRCRSHPTLLLENVNYWLHNEPARRLVRVLDNQVRAFVSDSFSTDKDNIDFAEAVLPVLMDMGVEVMSCDLTETKLYIKVVDKRILRDLPSGKLLPDGHKHFDTCSPALVLSNSEVGSASAAILTSVFTGGCTNMMVLSERSMRRYHVGAKHELAAEFSELLSDKTKRLTNAAFFSQVRDVVKGAFDVAKFDATIQGMAGAAENKITGSVEKVVEVTAKRFGMNDGQRNSVLKHLIEGGSLTQMGLMNAVTRTAQDLEDYDTASEFEAIGGKVIELPRSEWEVLAQAA